MKITIQSISDIITNSSSEVYVMYDKSGVEEVKRLVNSILDIAHTDCSFDDLFDVSFDIDEERAWELYEDDGGQEGTGLTFDEYIIEENSSRLDAELSPLICGIIVTAKANIKEHEVAARLLSNIGNIFECKEIYC